VRYVFLATGDELRFWEWQKEAFSRVVKTFYAQHWSDRADDRRLHPVAPVLRLRPVRSRRPPRLRAIRAAAAANGRARRDSDGPRPFIPLACRKC
jgi:hypothetical protein